MCCFKGFPTLYSFEPTLNSSPLIDIFGFCNQTYWVMLILLHYIFAIATIRLELSIDLTILLKKSRYLLSIVIARTTGVLCNILWLQFFWRCQHLPEHNCIIGFCFLELHCSLFNYCYVTMISFSCSWYHLKGGPGAAVEPTVCNWKVPGSSPSLYTFVWVRLEA